MKILLDFLANNQHIQSSRWLAHRVHWIVSTHNQSHGQSHDKPNNSTDKSDKSHDDTNRRRPVVCGIQTQWFIGHVPA